MSPHIPVRQPDPPLGSHQFPHWLRDSGQGQGPALPSLSWLWASAGVSVSRAPPCPPATSRLLQRALSRPSWEKPNRPPSSRDPDARPQCALLHHEPFRSMEISGRQCLSFLCSPGSIHQSGCQRQELTTAFVEHESECALSYPAFQTPSSSHPEHAHSV